MTMKHAKAEDFDVLAHQEEYAKLSSDPNAENASFDNIGNLLKLRDMLLRKRRFLANDAVVYPITYMGRALDLARIQPLIDNIDAVIEHEKRLAEERRGA